MNQDAFLYLDYQATTPLLPEVDAAMRPYYREHFANPSSREHLAGEKCHNAFLDHRHRVANILGCLDDEVLFTSGATESANLAIFGVLAQVATPERNTVLVSPFEHTCVLSPLRELASRGVLKISWLEHFQGRHTPEHILDKVNSGTLAVCLMAVNNEIGTIHSSPGFIEKLSTLEVLTLVDYSQALGKIPLNEDDSQRLADLGLFSAHKMYGPKGIGALTVSRRLLPAMKPLFYGGGQQQRIRPGTIPLPLIVGFSEALYQSTENVEIWAEKCRSLQNLIVTTLEKEGVQFRLNGCHLKGRVAQNLNIHFSKAPSETVLLEAPELGVSTGSACSGDNQNGSHVLKALGLNDVQCEESIRIGLSHLLNEENLMSAILHLAAVVCQIQKHNN